MAMVAIITIIGGSLKARAVPVMITHVDDIGVATTIRDGQAASTPELVRSTLARPNRRGPLATVLKGVVALGGARVIAQLSSSLSVAHQWTYAPAQFLLTGALLSADQDYATTLSRGRLPSFLFGALFPLLLALVAWRATLGAPAGTRAGVTVLASAMGTASIELSLHAAQMENYALTSIGGAVLLWRLLAADGARPSPRGAWIDGVVLALLTWCQYQFLFFMPAFAAARLWTWHRHGAPVREIARATLWAALPIAVSTAALYHYFLYLWVGAGVAWNAGPHNEYLFSIPAGAGFGGTVGYAVRFFAANTIATVTAISAFLPEGTAATAIGAVVAGCAGLGSWSAWREGTEAQRSLVVLTAVGAATWIALVLIKSITLGPTRHALIWLPILLLFFAIGVARLAGTRASVAGSLTALAVLGAMLWSFPRELRDRINPISEREFAALVDSTRAELVVGFACTNDPALMPAVRAAVFIKDCTDVPKYGHIYGAPVPDAPRRVLFVNTAAPMTGDDFRAMQRSLEVILKRPVLAHPDSAYTRNELRRVAVPGSTEWKRGLTIGGAGLFVTLYTLPEGPTAPAPVPTPAPSGRN